jgi:hypothetical protein
MPTVLLNLPPRARRTQSGRGGILVTKFLEAALRYTYAMASGRRFVGLPLNPPADRFAWQDPARHELPRSLPAPLCQQAGIGDPCPGNRRQVLREAEPAEHDMEDPSAFATGH